MNEITPMNIIRDIAGNIPVEYDELVSLKGGGAYDEQRRVIKIVNPTSTDGFNLALCAHEAFHAKRHREGTLMYDMPRNFLRTPFQMKEEAVVNDLAEAYINNLPLTPEQKMNAACMFKMSRTSYSTGNMVSHTLTLGTMVSLLLVQGVLEKIQGRKWTDWDDFKTTKKEMEAKLNAPGIPIDDNGNLIAPTEELGI